MAASNGENAVHMTQDESDRIKRTIESTLQRCDELKGQAYTKRSRDDLIASAKQLSFMADMAFSDSNSESLPILAVGRPYAPSMTRLEDLKAINLGDLKLETHHRGCVLHVKRVSPVVTLKASSWAAVEDSAGDVERLEFVLHKSRLGEDVLESESHYAIKEPYFTLNEQGEPGVRLHHPSDLVCIHSEENEVSSTSATALAEKSKNRGNACLSKKDYADAHHHYTEGIRLASQSAEASSLFKQDLHRNRAHLNLLLHRHSEAYSDALSALISGTDARSISLDTKSHLRAGLASYNLGHWTRAESHFQKILALDPSHTEAPTYLRTIQARISESTSPTPQHNIPKINSRLSPARPRVEAGTFSAPLSVRPSPLGGQGLFATRAIAKDEVVLIEKAFHVAFSGEGAWTAMTHDARDGRMRAHPAGLTQGVVRKLRDNPDLVPRVMDMFGDYRGTGESGLQDPEGAVVDVFRVHDIIARNAFGPGVPRQGGNVPDGDARTASAGLWVLGARANHSCVPNVVKEFLGDLLVMRASREVQEGEEVMHAYAEGPWEDRREKLWGTWGFECTCRLCRVESQEGEGIRRKRKEMMGKVGSLIAGRSPVEVNRLVVRKVELLYKELEASYDTKMYEGLPRMGMEELQQWLRRAKKMRD
ncbi:hypothetical protein CAC42_3752 [Sphaceloma murrayae]|uniref:SET domain-containing protein n=1 Tax=Sphaceloma murrayae TaxID=2082308 RepID=A0A2K1QH15_9PEZI|nr:hypothetical protein CAC42_3752 [Sphaceloma murrayae]